MAQGNGCKLQNCPHLRKSRNGGSMLGCYHPSPVESENCPLTNEEIEKITGKAVTLPQTSQAPVIYPEPEEDVEDLGKWYSAWNARR